MAVVRCIIIGKSERLRNNTELYPLEVQNFFSAKKNPIGMMIKEGDTVPSVHHNPTVKA